MWIPMFLQQKTLDAEIARIANFIMIMQKLWILFSPIQISLPFYSCIRYFL